MSTWVISFAGIGPVALDRPVGDVLAEVGSGEASCRPEVAAFFNSAVVGVGDNSDQALIRVAMTGPGEEVALAARPHTDAGIATGSTFDALLAAYPAAEAFTDSNGRPGFRITDGTSWIHFTSTEGTIINGIDVSRDAIDLKEYCG